MMEESGREHRRFPRIPAERSVLVQGIDPPSEGFARTKVMSRAGCGLLTREPMQAGVVVDLLITLDAAVVRVTGRTIYVRPVGDGRVEAGIEFLDVSEDDRRLLEATLEREVADG